RHTRSKRDWSSDVCSSDLTPNEVYGFNFYNPITVRAAQGPLPFEMVPTPGAAMTGFGPMWPIRPDTMRDLLIDMKHRYGDRLPRSEERRVGKEGRGRRPPQ